MREYLVVLVVTATVTYLLTPLVRLFAIRIGALAAVRDRDVHAVPTPRLGGLAMLGGIVAGVITASHLSLLRFVFENTRDPQALLSAAVLISLLGVLDDRFGLDAVTKLAGQVLVAGVLVLQGVQLLWLPTTPVFVLPPVTGVVVTVLVVVVMINAVNFVDGLDGLAAGLVAIGSLAFFGFSYLIAVDRGLERAATPSLVTVVLAGACLGFLPHNLYPARLFMGDSGSMLLGLLLASAMITLTGQVDPSQLSGQTIAPALVPALLPVLMPVLVMVVPLADLLFAVVRRTRAGQAPWAPDKRHLHHRLLEIGHSQRRAVGYIYLWSATIAFGAMALSFVDSYLVLGVVVLVAVASAVALVLGRHRGAALIAPEVSPGEPAPAPAPTPTGSGGRST
ncbi:MAG: glycosyltransferase family 4 protein [Actinomycetes bacterium]